MTRGILIAGNESGLMHAIGAEAEKRVEHYAAALIPSRLSDSISAALPAGEKQKQESKSYALQWNPGSPISARTLVLAAENRLGQINEALLVCAPASVRKAASELSMPDIEVLVNDHIKGWFFLVKELSAMFRVRGSGTLAMIFPDISTGGSREDNADILGPSALASFQAFTRSLLLSAQNEPYMTLGFSCSEPGAENGFASYIFKLLDEGSKRNSGKLHKFGKLRIFS